MNLLTGPQYTCERWPQVRLDSEANDGIGTSSNSSSSNSGNRSSDDQCCAVWRDTADEAAQFEDKNRDEVRYFEVEVFESLAPSLK